MFSLVKDRLLPRREAMRLTEVDVAALVTEWEDIDEWFNVNTEGRTIGGMRLTMYETQRPVGFRADLNFIMNLRVFRRDLQVWVRGAAQLDNLFNLDHIELSMAAWNVMMDMRARAMPDGRLLVEIKPDDTQIPERFVVPIDREISLMDAVRSIALRRMELQLGQSYSIPVIDPIYQMRRGDMILTVENYDFVHLLGEDEPRRVLRLISSFGGFESRLYVDNEGRIIRRQLMPKRDLFLDRTEEALFLRRHPRLRRYLQEHIEPQVLDPTDFDGAPSRLLEELFNESIFRALSVLPEVEKKP
jgi:hypothetical protein